MPKLGKNYFKELNKLLAHARPDFTHIRVAAIIVTDKGAFKGVNYEDSVCSLSICAERNAILNAVTNGMTQIYEIHVLSPMANMSMCGACRQMACSFATKDTMVYDYDFNTGKRNQTPFGQLMPKSPFLAKNANKK